MKKEETVTGESLVNGYILGQMSIWAVFQILAVPLIFLHTSFTLLLVIFCIVTGVLSIWGILKMRRHRWKLSVPRLGSFVMWVVLAATVGVIVFQLWKYVFGLHLDEDDSRWIAEAGDALSKNSMFLHNPATGSYLGSFQGEILKDVVSPFPMFLAVLSGLTMIRPAVMAHTIYAPILLLLSYAAFWRLGRLLFKKIQEQIIFLLGVSVISLFCYGAGASAANFALTRIWQGKAVVAAVLIPSILSQVVLIQKEDTVQNWLILCIMGCAGSLLSGMGIVISLIMIGGYGFYIVICKRWRRIPLWILSMVPAAVFEIWSQLI